MRSRSILALALLASAFAANAAETLNPRGEFSEQHAGAPLDLTGYTLAFADEFDRRSITDDGGAGPWFAPVHSDFGEATFDAAGRYPDTYGIADGKLSIRAHKWSNGRWHAGNLQTVDSRGRGFAQAYGYFEARMRFPDMPGAWAAFWLKSRTEHVDQSIVRPEIDVVEWYGGDPKGHHQAVHLWPPPKSYQTPGRLTTRWDKSNYTGMRPTIAGQWHTHGVLVTPEDVIFYVDGKEISRFPTFAEFTLPLYPIVTLTLHEKEFALAKPPFYLDVDYVRVYARKSPREPTDVRVK